VTNAFSENPYAPRLLFEHVLFSEDEVLDEFVSAYARPNLEVLRGLLTAGERAGRLRSVDADVVVPQIIGTIVFFFLASPLISRIFDLDPGNPEHAARFADSAAELLLHGIERRPVERAS
jgi:hypothetical protein